MKIKEEDLISGKRVIAKQYTISPDTGYYLRNKLTGVIITNFIVVYSKRAINNFEEVRF